MSYSELLENKAYLVSASVESSLDQYSEGGSKSGLLLRDGMSFFEL